VNSESLEEVTMYRVDKQDNLNESPSKNPRILNLNITTKVFEVPDTISSPIKSSNFAPRPLKKSK